MRDGWIVVQHMLAFISPFNWVTPITAASPKMNLFDRLTQLLPVFAQKLLHTEFVKYGVSGTIAFIFDFGILVLGTELLGLHYLISNIGGYAVGFAITYTLNVKWVFQHRRFGGARGMELTLFIAIVFLGLGVSELVIYLATELGQLPYTWSKVVATVFVFLFNFTAKKLLLFPSPGPDAPIK